MDLHLMTAMYHNGKIIENVERTLRDCLSSGIALYLENPDGTTIKIQKGFKLKSYEGVVFSSGTVERLDFNE